MGEARVDAGGDLVGLLVAPVAPGAGGVPAVGRLVGDLEPKAFEVVLAELLHEAAAAPAVQRVVGAPERVVPGQHGAVPGQMLGPGAGVLHGAVAQVGHDPGEPLDALPLSVRGGHAQVGVEDDAQAVERAELHDPCLPGERIGHALAPPPALAAQDRFQFVAEVVEGPPLGLDPVHRGADVLEDVEPGDLGDGEGGDVLAGAGVAPVIADEEALGAEVGDGLGIGDVQALRFGHDPTLRACESFVCARRIPPCLSADDFRVFHHLKWSLSLWPRF